MMRVYPLSRNVRATAATSRMCFWGERCRHPSVIEDEVERPADVGVGVAEAGENGGAAQVDHTSGGAVEVETALRHPHDPLAFDQDIGSRRASPRGRPNS